MKNLMKNSLLLGLLAGSSLAFSQHNFESPAADSEQSGVGIIRGWACDAKEVKVIIDDEHELQLPYGGSRGDTEKVCGDSDNGFAATIFYGLFGIGEHDIDFYMDGKKISSRKFTVASPTEKFLRGQEKHITIKGFPAAGQDSELMWSEAHQNFVIIDTHSADTAWAMETIEKRSSSKTTSYSNDDPAVLVIKSPFNDPIKVKIFSLGYEETKTNHRIEIAADMGGLITLSPANDELVGYDIPVILTLD